MNRQSSPEIPVSPIRVATSEELHHEWQRRVKWGLFLIFLAGFLAAMMFHVTRYARGETVLRGSAMVNSIGTVVEWTPQAASVTGAGEMFGKDIFSLIPDQRRESLRHEFERSQRPGPY